MNIGLKCFATLADADRCDYRNSTSKTLRALIVHLWLPVWVLFANSGSSPL